MALGLAVMALGFAAIPRFAAADAGAWIVRGDEAYARGQLEEAISDYSTAVQESPHSLHALCRLVRAESERAEDAPGQIRQRLVASAVEHARAAVAVAPDSAISHAWLATALGRQALHEGARSRLALAREIKSEADRTIALDPRNSRAYHVRGVWNREVATLNFIERAAANTVLGGVPKGASLDNAVADFEKAVALDPDYVHHHLELGRTYHQVHRDADARRELERAIALPPTRSARDAHYQTEARELLSRLKHRP